MSSLQQEAQRAWSIIQQRAEKAKIAEAQKEEEEKQQRISDFQALIEKEFNPAILQELQGTCEIIRHLGATQPAFTFKYEGLQWRISKQSSRNWEDPWVWDIWAAYNDQCRAWTHGTIAQEKLQGALLIELGKRFTEQEKIRQQQAEDARRSEENAAKFQAEEELRKQEEVEQLRKADEVDARLRAALEEKRQQILASSWKWPEGVTKTIWYIHFSKGTGRDEDGETFVEMDGGWVLCDELDENGYAVLQPYHYYRHSVKPARKLKLSQMFPNVYWEEKTWSSLADIPEELTDPIEMEFPGVSLEPAYVWSDQKARLIENKEYTWQETIGRTPLQWVRDFVGGN